MKKSALVCFIVFALLAGRLIALPIEKIKLPPGFKIEIYAKDIPGARSLALSPSGTLFVGSRAEGRVYAVSNGKVMVVDDALFMPNGVAFHKGDLYVAEVNRILRYRDVEAHLTDFPSSEVVFDKLPSNTYHGWKFIRFGPDGKLYFPIGAPCNVCGQGDPYATIDRVNTDGSSFEIYARGVRNSVGFDWDPRTHELWFTDNGQDWLGDELPPDELNRAPRPGLHFGFPYVYGNNVRDPESDYKEQIKNFTPPEMLLPAHVAALGMRFYTGKMFPAEYHDQIFIAEHGSWNRSKPIGYRVSLIKFKRGRPVSYQVFAEGWLQNEEAWGRPVDVEVMRDGSLLVSDDQAGAIYRISYR